VQEGCGYKDTLRAHRYFAPSAKYFTVCITYQPPLVYFRMSRNDRQRYVLQSLNWMSSRNEKSKPRATERKTIFSIGIFSDVFAGMNLTLRRL